MCSKKGACENDVSGDQSRPVLSGDQNHVNSDGTCKYGHVSTEGSCKPGWDCGYTWFDCVCIDEEAAKAGVEDSGKLLFWAGIFLCLAGTSLLGGICYVEMTRTSSSGRSVAPSEMQTSRPVAQPETVGRMTPGSWASPQVMFSDPFGPPPVGVHPLDSRRPKVSQYANSSNMDTKAADIDGCGILCIVLLGSVVVIGLILIYLALSADDDQYYNQCESA